MQRQMHYKLFIKFTTIYQIFAVNRSEYRVRFLCLIAYGRIVLRLHAVPTV